MMAKAVPSPILQLIRGVVEDQSVRQLSDHHLLQQFNDQQDEAAFGVLLRRHGPMVLDVCRGVLGDEADAEDAFQATFLILARKALSIQKRSSVGSWLHGVAYRTALKARAQSATRQKKEACAPARQVSEPDDVTWREVRQVLHQELSGLAERYRAPLALCYLEGKTQDEVAGQLGLATSTLKERLERGRSLLRARLVRRGLGPAAVLLATAWPSATATAFVRTALVSTTCKAATMVAAGQTAAVPLRVAALTEGVLKAMLFTKLKMTTAVLLAVVVAAVGVAVTIFQAQAAPQPQSANTARRASQDQGSPKAEPKPVVVREDSQIRKLAWSSNGKILATVGIAYETVEFTDGDGNPTDKGGVIPHSTIKLWDARTGKLKCSLGEEKNTYIAAIAFSADGKTAAISTSKHILTNQPDNPLKYETEVRVLDARTWTLKHKVKADGFASALAFSPDGMCLALGGNKGFAQNTSFVRLWDIRKQKVIGLTEGGGYRVACLAFSIDGTQLATGDENGRVRVFDGRTAAARQNFEGHGPLRSGGEQCVTGVGFSPDGKTLVSGSMDKTLKLWDVEAGKLVRTLEGNKAPVAALAFSPDGQLFASAGRVTVEDQSKVEVILWDTKTGRPKKAFADQTIPVNALAFSPDGSTLAIGAGDGFNRKVNTGTGRAKTPGEFQLWKLNKTGEADKKADSEPVPTSPMEVKTDESTPDVRTLKGHTGAVHFAAFSPSGQILVTAAKGINFTKPAAPRGADELIIWDVIAQRAKHKIPFKVRIWSMTLSADAKTLAVGTGDGIELLNAATGKTKRTLNGPWALSTGPFSLAFAPDGKTLAAGGSARDNMVRLWDVPTGKLTGTLKGHEDAVVGLRFSPDGRTLASTGGQYDTTIRYWEVATGKLRRTVKRAKEESKDGTEAVDGDWQTWPAAFSPDGKILARGRGAEVKFWDVRTGGIKDRVIEDSHPYSRIVQSLAFSPDGKRVAGGRTSGEIDVWETRPADGKKDWRIGDLKQTLKEEHSHPVMALAFSPSGELLVSGDVEGRVRVWKMPKK